jgi:hypothetical protein
MATVLQHFTSFIAAIHIQHLPQVEHLHMQEDILNPNFSAYIKAVLKITCTKHTTSDYG